MNTMDWSTKHKQIWRLNHDRPMFVRVKYLEITELTIATLFAQVFVMRHQTSCCRFFAFPAGSLVASWKTIEPPPQLCCFIPTAPVQYQLSLLQWQCHESSWEIAGSYYMFKGHPASSQDGLSWSRQLRSDGPRVIRQGSWSCRAVAQRRPRVSKLGLKVYRRQSFLAIFVFPSQKNNIV